MQKKVEMLICDTLQKHPPSLQECCSQQKKDTLLGRLAVKVRAPMLIERLDQALQSLEQALQSLETAGTQTDMDQELLTKFKKDLTAFRLLHNEESPEATTYYWKIKEQAESHLLEEEAESHLLEEEAEATRTKDKILEIWKELLTNTHPAEQKLKSQGWHSQGEGKNITNDLQINLHKNVPRTEFLITPRIETFSRDESSEHPLRLKEISDVLRSRIETELRKSLIPSINKQLQENTSKIEDLNKHIKSLKDDIEIKGISSLRDLLSQYEKERQNRKDAIRHLKAAKYYAQTGEQPFGYDYTIVARFYTLEKKRPHVLTRKTKEESQIYITSEAVSITDKFKVGDGVLNLVISGNRKQVAEPEGDGVWELSLEKGAQELHQDTNTIKLLKDYRLMTPSSTTIILHEGQKILYMTNQSKMLSGEVENHIGFLGHYRGHYRQGRKKQPDDLKFIYPHQYEQ